MLKDFFNTFGGDLYNYGIGVLGDYINYFYNKGKGQVGDKVWVANDLLNGLYSNSKLSFVTCSLNDT